MKRMSPKVEPERSCYCARCQAPTTESAVACARCETPFEGAGRFDRIAGEAPSTDFAFLFAREIPAATSRAA